MYGQTLFRFAGMLEKSLFSCNLFVSKEVERSDNKRASVGPVWHFWKLVNLQRHNKSIHYILHIPDQQRPRGSELGSAWPCPSRSGLYRRAG